MRYIQTLDSIFIIITHSFRFIQAQIAMKNLFFTLTSVPALQVLLTDYLMHNKHCCFMPLNHLLPYTAGFGLDIQEF